MTDYHNRKPIPPRRRDDTIICLTAMALELLSEGLPPNVQELIKNLNAAVDNKYRTPD